VRGRNTSSISTGGWIAIVLVLLVLAGLVGLVCGGEKTLTRDALIAQADAICTENNATLAELNKTEEGVPLENTDRAALAVERLSVPGLDTTRRMAELVPDPAIARPYDEFIRLRRQRDELQKQVAQALRAGDARAAGDAQTRALRLYNGPIRDRAQTIGFKVCGQPLPEQ
jgi:hypothetical protein